MIKTILKETGIMILLCVAIILVFGITFYDYIPISKIIPNKVAYVVPEEVQNDLNIDVEVEQVQTQTLTFTVDAADLKKHEKSGSLQKGKLNPFEAYSQNTNSTNTNENNLPANNNTNPNSTGTYYPNTGTK